MYRAGIAKITDMGAKEGFWKPDLIDTMQANPAYATFQVIDYLDLNVPASIKHQVGTLKDVTNPADATIVKTISILRAIERNQVKKKLVSFLKQYHPSDIQQAKYVYNGKTQMPIEPKDPDLALFTTIENGKYTGYYVDPYIADTIQNFSTGQLGAVLSTLRFINSKFWRPLFITFNLGFQTFNLFRDFIGTWKRTPNMSLFNLFKLYGESLPSAYKRAWNIPDKTIAEMEKNKMLSITYNDVVAGMADENKQIEFELARAGINEYQPKETARILKPFKLVLDTIERMGNLVETLPKVAGYKHLNGKLPPMELAHLIRTQVGSPDFLRKGAGYGWYNEVFLFSNAIKEGIRSDLHAATNPRTRSGYWFKTASVTFLPKIIMMMAAAGLFGEWLKELFANVSEYDKANYTIVPIGMDKNGQSIILRIPQDETGRLLGGILWKAMNLTQKKNIGFDDLAEILSYTGGQVPSVTPTIDAITSTAQFVAGQNPYDFFRGQNVLTDDQFAAGGWYALKPFLLWEFNQLGGGVLLKPSYSVQSPETKTWTQKVIEAPVLSNVIGRWIKVTNQGQRERNREIIQNIQQEKAVQRIENTNELKKAVEEYQAGNQTLAEKWRIERALVEEVVGKPPYTSAQKTQRTLLIKKFNVSVIKGKVDPDVNSLISAQSVDEKVALLKDMKRSRSDKEMDTLMRDMLKQKIISGEVIRKYKTQ